MVDNVRLHTACIVRKTTALFQDDTIDTFLPMFLKFEDFGHFILVPCGFLVPYELILLCVTINVASLQKSAKILFV